jgi:hypothetical protein
VSEKDPSTHKHKDHAWTMLLDEACRVVAGHLRAHQQEFVMLKGATIAGWLYADPLQRTYTDLDLLIHQRDESHIVGLLGDLGFTPLLDRASLGFSSPEEQPLRNKLGIVIDLHTALQGVRVSADEAWRVLRAETVSWSWAGTAVPALAPPARAMHLALHLAQRGLEDGKAAKDLELGLTQLEPRVWTDARDLAERLNAMEAFSAGLMLLPQGESLKAQLRLRPIENVEAKMRASSASPSAILLDRVLAIPGWRQRVQMVITQLFPTTAWLKLYYPRQADTVWGRAALRLRRPWAVLFRLPAALRERGQYRE